jgi:hypothetical protein
MDEMMEYFIETYDGKQDPYKVYKQVLKLHPSPEGGSWNPPKTKKGRKELLDKCGKRAFLEPSDLKYPVIQNSKTCKVERQGVIAAKKRAAQYHHPELVEKADDLLREKKQKGLVFL